ncbi:MAG: insulinase family protein [Candidatus Nomurabacteria bacterium]|jgi:predicted Zn-dependent peptidase|nr:insulinase family protein [Candidatus Nomurabacteria bacterium]
MQYEVSEFILKAGGRGLIVNVPSAPVMSTQFHFRAGDRYVKNASEKWETAHIMEHMAFGANRDFASGTEFDTVFTENGAYHNAYTSGTGMAYTASCANFEWERILALQKLVICYPKFTEDEFEAEYGNVRGELTGYLSDAERVLWPKIAQMLGDNTLTYQERLDLMPNISVADVREHYARTHTSGNLRFVVAGDFTGKLTHLREILNSFELNNGDRPPLPVDELHSFAPFVIRRKDVPDITFGWTMSLPRRLSDDESAAMDVLDHILNGTLHARIQGEARKRGLVYGIWSDTSAGEHNSSWDFGASVEVDKLDKLFDLIVREMRRIQDGDLSDEEIESAKQYALGRHQMGIQTVGQLNQWFANRYFFDGRIEDFASQPSRIKNVTRERIIETAHDFFRSNCWGLGLYGNTDKAVADKLHEKLTKLF